MQNAKVKMQNSKWTRFFLLNLHFSFCTFHFSMKFSVFFQNAKLLPLDKAEEKWIKKKTEQKWRN
jgi:hypothetical protein